VKAIGKSVKEMKRTQILCHKLNQIRRRIELCMRKVMLCFEMNL
jgi:hypothetical protein